MGLLWPSLSCFGGKTGGAPGHPSTGSLERGDGVAHIRIEALATGVECRADLYRERTDWPGSDHSAL